MTSLPEAFEEGVVIEGEVDVGACQIDLEVPGSVRDWIILYVILDKEGKNSKNRDLLTVGLMPKDP